MDKAKVNGSRNVDDPSSITNFKTTNIDPGKKKMHMNKDRSKKLHGKRTQSSSSNYEDGKQLLKEPSSASL